AEARRLHCRCRPWARLDAAHRLRHTASVASSEHWEGRTTTGRKHARAAHLPAAAWSAPDRVSRRRETSRGMRRGRSHRNMPAHSPERVALPPSRMPACLLGRPAPNRTPVRSERIPATARFPAAVAKAETDRSAKRSAAPAGRSREANPKNSSSQFPLETFRPAGRSYRTHGTEAALRQLAAEPALDIFRPPQAARPPGPPWHWAIDLPVSMDDLMAWKPPAGG